MTIDDARPSTPAAESSDRPGRRVIAAALVIAAIVVGGVVLTVFNLIGGGPSDPAVTPSPSTTSVSTGAADAGQASACGLSDVELTGTVATAPAATWALVGTVAAPSIEHQGPGRIDPDGYRSCYAHTPTGALLAAANYGAMGSNPALRKKFNERAPVPGPGRDALLKKPIAGGGQTGVRIQLGGFRVLRYTGQQADIDLAYRSSNGVFIASVLNLQWSEGDWKIPVADDGTELSTYSQLPSLAGYVYWSGA